MLQSCLGWKCHNIILPHFTPGEQSPYEVLTKPYSTDAAYMNIPDIVWACLWQSGWSVPSTLPLPSRHPFRISHNPLGTGNVITDVVIQKFWKEKWMSGEGKIPFPVLINIFWEGFPEETALRFRNLLSLEPFGGFAFHLLGFCAFAKNLSLSPLSSRRHPALEGLGRAFVSGDCLVCLE